MSEMKQIALIGTGIAVGVYLIFVGLVAFNNVQNQMAWCQYKDGIGYWEGNGDVVRTNKRWSPNPLTMGFTGECINPGDKGL